MKLFSGKTCCFNLRPKKRSFVCVSLLLILIILGYLSRNISEHSHHPDLNDASFLMRPDSRCGVGHPFLVLLVTSAQGQFEARSAIRQTWGREQSTHGKRVVTYFLLGYSREHQQHLLEEGLLHKDIIQKEFSDTYYNLTTKVLMGLEWVSRFCPSAAFVMKTDSDMFVNVDFLRELWSRTSHRNVFTGYILRHVRPVRDKSNKWYLSEEEYPLETYPPYCSGTGYVLLTDVACRVWNVSKSVPKLKIEDIFIALCLAELKIEPVELHSRKIFEESKFPFSVCAFRNLVTSQRVKPYEMLIYWKALAGAATEDCPGDT